MPVANVSASEMNMRPIEYLLVTSEVVVIVVVRGPDVEIGLPP